MAKLTAEDKKWRAESDAYTLIEAQSIMEDASRKKAAMSKVRGIAQDAKKRANAAEKVAKKKVTKSKAKSKK